MIETMSEAIEINKNKKKGENNMTAAQEEKRNVTSQIEDVTEIMPLLKELSTDEKIFIKGMMAGTIQTMKMFGTKTA